jgi:hypothetical protein
MKMHREAELYIDSFLTVTLDGGDWSAACPNLFTFGDEYPVPTE